MKLVTALILAMAADAAMAAAATEPAYRCNASQGCRVEQGAAYDIGRGAKISLPSGWTVYSYPTAPDPAMAGPREFRAFKDDLLVAISPFPNIDHRVISEAFLCDIEKKAGARYASQSKE
jgi:hypothetical protein